MAEASYIGENTDLILGQDFLTWLWYKSETSNGLFRMSKGTAKAGEPFSLNMEQRVVVRGGEGDNRETASVSGSLSPLREARLGLLTGKLVVRALARLEKDGMNWQVTLGQMISVSVHCALRRWQKVRKVTIQMRCFWKKSTSLKAAWICWMTYIVSS